MPIYYRRKKITDPFNPDGKKMYENEVVPTGVVTTEDIVNEVQKNTGLPREELSHIMENLENLIFQSMKEKKPFTLPRFGTFKPVYKKYKVPAIKGKKSRIVEDVTIEFVPSEKLNEHMKKAELIELKEGEDIPESEKL